VTSKICSFTNKSVSARILETINDKGQLKSMSAAEISNVIFTFSQNKWYEFFPSLLDARKETAFLNQLNFEDNYHILLILPDNCCQELFLILKSIQNKKLDQLANATHTIIDVVINTGNLKTNAKIVKSLESISAIIKHHKINVNFIGDFEEIKFNQKYDTIYLNDNTSNYNDHLNFLLSNQAFKKKHTKLLANHVMMGGEGAMDFLMYVRRDDRFECEFLVGDLESSPKDKMFMDGIEKVVLV